MFRVSFARLGVSSYTRFLIESKGKEEFKNLDFNARSAAISKAYKAVMANSTQRAKLLRQASATKSFGGRKKADRKPSVNSLHHFRAAVVKAKLIRGDLNKTPAGFGRFSKKTTALWEQYKAAAIAQNGGNPLKKNLTTFNLKLLRK